jgi:hypothetical protein
MRWGRTWWLTVALFALALGGLEAAWRASGHTPSVVDDDALWAEQLSRLDSDPGTVVLIGMSRMQLDFSSEVFHRRFPGRKLIRLEAPLRHPVSALRILAMDGGFRGTVIASVSLPWLRNGVYQGFAREMKFYRDHYGPNERFNRNVATVVQANLVSVHPTLNLRDAIVARVSRERWPDPHFIQTLADRSRIGLYDLHPNIRYFSRGLALVTANRHEERHVSPKALIRQLGPMQQLSLRIAARGGRVVLVRLPTSGRIWEEDEKWYPKAQYWDVFARQSVSATLHWRDAPRLADFETVDGSHLDGSLRDRFTERLLDELEAKGLLDIPGQ